ncbi:MAG: polysaccharide deacetylase family protein [Bacteroidales bacterium]
MLAIYSKQSSSRLQYICEVIFKNILGIDFFITSDQQKFDSFEDLKIKYEKKSELLFETFLASQNESVLLQDKLATAFYIVTNYEEYLPDTQRDLHGRLLSQYSLVVKNKWDRQPYVHHLALSFQEELSKQNPCFIWPERKYKFIPTFDVDMAYSSKGKSLPIFLGAFAKSLLNGDGKKRKELWQAKFKIDFQDPFDVFDLQKEEVTKYGLKPLYFWLTSEYTRFDKNIKPSSVEFKKLIIQQQKYADIGLHPSYYANGEQTEREKSSLEKITGQTITRSRQHFLRLSFPETYQNLVKIGIKEDYTLGYYDRIGFRNGMAMPFPFFDVTNNCSTDLILHPFPFMDSALLEQHLEKEEYLKQVQEIAHEVRKVHGEMIAVWHNYLMPHGSSSLDLFTETLKLLV